MTTTADETALLHAIRTYPAEDTPRLAYADYLDETGGSNDPCKQCRGSGEASQHWDPASGTWRGGGPCYYCSSSGRVSDGRRERAEFIRVQIALHRHPHGKAVQAGEYDASDGVGPEWQGAFDAQERGRVLWRKWSSRWFGLGITRNPVPLTPNEVDPRVRRGFVFEVRLTLVAFLDAAPELFSTHPIERVTLIDREPDSFRDGSQWFWYVEDLVPDDIANRAVLPVPLWRLLAPAQPPTEFVARGYYTRDEAMAALSTACVAYGRGLAGLPT